MKRPISFWQKIGFVFTVGLGVLFHFLYEWSNESVFVAAFSGVNESTWEHMKLFFFPMVIFAVIESFIFKEYKNFWNIKLKGILLGLLLIPLLYYFYNGVIGKSPDWVNIFIFVLTIFIVYLYETKQFNKRENMDKESNASFFIIILIIGLFTLFTFATPEIGIFKDPSNGSYGINYFLLLSI